MIPNALAMGIGGVLVLSILAGGVLLLRRWAAGRTARREQDDVARPAPAEVETQEGSDLGERTADEADFASEHSQSTFAFDQPGGPEGTPEAESPRGLAGMDESRATGGRSRQRRRSRDES